MATIQKRKWKTKTTFRALVRRKGFKDLHKSFNTRADAQVWARDIERNLDRGLATDYSEASKHTLKDILKRYIKEELALGAACDVFLLEVLYASS